MKNKKIIFRDLGIIDYKQAWDYQEQLFESIVSRKLQNRTLPEEQQQLTDNYLLFCEHPHVYTLGKSGKENNLLVKDDFLKSINASYYKINRGGDITYHGPGQLVGYPIFDLDNFYTDIHRFLREIEEIIIQTIAEYNIKGNRLAGATGVWIDTGTPKERKICAIGVRTSHWVTMHGFAFNVNTDLNYFNYINPCGFVDKGVTSLEKETGTTQDMNIIKQCVLNKICDIFEAKLVLQE